MQKTCRSKTNNNRLFEYETYHILARAISRAKFRQTQQVCADTTSFLYDTATLCFQYKISYLES